MDGWFDDPESPERWQTYYQCMECGGWTLCQGSKETNGHHVRDQKCEHCGSGRFNPQSATSKRTFNVDRAKKKEAEVKKVIAKRKQF